MYLTNPGAGTIAGFGVDRSTGALTPLASSPTTPSGQPVALTIDAQARFAYVGMRYGPDALAAYAIDRQTGALTAVPCSGLAAPPISAEISGLAGERLTLASIVLHPSGRFAYVTFDYYCDECICGVEAWLYVYAVGSATGILTRLDLPPVDVGRAGDNDAPPDGASAVSIVAGSFLYATNRGVTGGMCHPNSELSGFVVDSAGGGLRRLEAISFPVGNPNDGDGHRWLLLRPAGDFLYLARQQDTVQFKLKKANGVLKERGTSPRVGPAVFSPSGRLYSAASLDAVQGLDVFDVQPDAGQLIPTPGAFVATPGAVSTIAVDSSGRFLYAAQSEVGVITAFAIDAATGLLRPAPGAPTVVGAEQPSSSDFRILAIADVPGASPGPVDSN